MILVEEADGGGNQRLRVVRRKRGRRRELPFRGDRSPGALPPDALEEHPLDTRRRARERRDELRQAVRRVRMEEVARADGRRRIGLDALCRPELGERGGVLAVPEEGEPQVQVNEG